MTFILIYFMLTAPIGFCLGMVFIFGFLYWGWKNIQPHIRQAGTNPNKNLYWTLCAWFWLGYAAWLINGIFGHDFYRIWWLALAMCNMGIMIGAVVNGKNLSPAIMNACQKLFIWTIGFQNFQCFILCDDLVAACRVLQPIFWTITKLNTTWTCCVFKRSGAVFLQIESIFRGQIANFSLRVLQVLIANQSYRA